MLHLQKKKELQKKERGERVSLKCEKGGKRGGREDVKNEK